MWTIPIICMSLPDDSMFSIHRFKPMLMSLSGALSMITIHNSTVCMVYDMLEVSANMCWWYARVMSHGLAVRHSQKALPMLILLMLLLYL